MRGALDIDLAQVDPAHRVQITISNNHSSPATVDSVVGVLTEDLSIAMGSGFEDPGEGMLASFLNKGSGLLDIANRFGAEIGQTRATSLRASMLSWKGGEHFKFSLKLRFVATRPDRDVRDEMLALQRCVLPTFSGFESTLGVIRAPLGYARESDARKPVGCVGVSIGRWFAVPPILIVKSLNMNFSKEVIGSGNPLMSAAEVSFETASIMDVDTVAAFFVRRK